MSKKEEYEMLELEVLVSLAEDYGDLCKLSDGDIEEEDTNLIRRMALYIRGVLAARGIA